MKKIAQEIQQRAIVCCDNLEIDVISRDTRLIGIPCYELLFTNHLSVHSCKNILIITVSMFMYRFIFRFFFQILYFKDKIEKS